MTVTPSVTAATATRHQQGSNNTINNFSNRNHNKKGINGSNNGRWSERKMEELGGTEERPICENPSFTVLTVLVELQDLKPSSAVSSPLSSFNSLFFAGIHPPGHSEMARVACTVCVCPVRPVSMAKLWIKLVAQILILELHLLVTVCVLAGTTQLWDSTFYLPSKEEVRHVRGSIMQIAAVSDGAKKSIWLHGCLPLYRHMDASTQKDDTTFLFSKELLTPYLNGVAWAVCGRQWELRSATWQPWKNATIAALMQPLSGMLALPATTGCTTWVHPGMFAAPCDALSLSVIQLGTVADVARQHDVRPRKSLFRRLCKYHVGHSEKNTDCQCRKGWDWERQLCCTLSDSGISVYIFIKNVVYYAVTYINI